MRDREPPDPEPMHPNITTQPDNTGSRSSNTQPTVADEHYDLFTRTPSSSNPEHQNVLIECNVLVEEYPKGETPKSTVYVEIQSKLAKALGDDRAKSDAAFGSFIATIESHDSELMQAARRGATFDPRGHSASPALTKPPLQEFDNSEAVMTINRNPHLFHIVTPIKIDQFERLLEAHPNRPFVDSVCSSLREGFWPWAHTQNKEYPVTWDFSDRPPKNEDEAEFLRSQRDIEIAAERYSEGFGTELLPGMYSTPVHVIPKPRSVKLRLVNDHSVGPFSLNSMIAREDIVGAKMDSIADLTAALL